MTTKTKRNSPYWLDVLQDLDACTPAFRWCKKQPSLRVAWARCINGEWIEWLLDILYIDNERIYKVQRRYGDKRSDAIMKGTWGESKKEADILLAKELKGVVSWERIEKEWKRKVNHGAW